MATAMEMRPSPQPWRPGAPFVETEPQANITVLLLAMDVKASSVDPYAKITSTLAGSFLSFVAGLSFKIHDFLDDKNYTGSTVTVLLTKINGINAGIAGWGNVSKLA